MFKLESGVLDKTRLIANILMLVLLIGNIFFSVQYIQEIKNQNAPKVDNTSQRIQIARFLKEYIAIVLNNKNAVSTEDRVKLENDEMQLHDAHISNQWQAFVNSSDASAAQQNAVKLMSVLADKMLP